MPNYIHIYKDRKHYITLEDDSNLVSIIENLLTQEPGAWIMFQDSTDPVPPLPVDIPEINPSFAELELTPSGRELLTTLAELGVDHIEIAHFPNNE